MEIKTEVITPENAQNKKPFTPRFKYLPEHVDEIFKHCTVELSKPGRPSFKMPKKFWTQFAREFNQKFKTQQTASALKSKYHKLVEDCKLGFSPYTDRRKGAPRPRAVSSSCPRTIAVVKQYLVEYPDDAYVKLSQKLSVEQNLKLSKSTIALINKNLGFKKKKLFVGYKNQKRGKNGRFVAIRCGQILPCHCPHRPAPSRTGFFKKTYIFWA